MKIYLIVLILVIGCTNANHQTNITDIYYSISSAQEEEGGTYYSISTPFKIISDSSKTGLWFVKMRKLIHLNSNEESIIYILVAKHADKRKLNPPVYLPQNKFYAYGFINGVKTYMKDQMKTEHEEIRADNRPVYLNEYGLSLNKSDLGALEKVDGLFFVLETERRTEDGFPLNIEVEVKPPVLDTLKLMIMDDWKSQLKRVQEQAK